MSHNISHHPVDDSAAEGDLAGAIRRGAALLAEAGLDTPLADVRLLAAHVLDVGLGELDAAALRGAPAPPGLTELVARRAEGVPVQHLTGVAAFRRRDVRVGPGVFVPRPETELVAQAAIDAAAGSAPSTVVELCAGSAAIACAVLDEVPHSTVVAVEIDRVAAGFAARNLTDLGHRSRLVIGDATDPACLADLDSAVDVVVVNPPYVPDGAPVAAEVGYDPSLAVYGGPRGYELPLRLAARAIALLRPGGTFVMEHHDQGQDEILAALADLGFVDVRGHRDLTGRPRFVVARRASAQ